MTTMLIIFLVLISLLCCAQCSKAPFGESFPGPESPSVQLQWLRTLVKSRTEWKQRNNYTDFVYTHYNLSSSKMFVVPQSHLFDRYLFDSDAGQWTPDRFLDDLQARYGGVDGVLLWWGYPNLGVDERSQFDLMSDVPGGYDGLASVVEAFHRRGVQVGLPYNPWDVGTTRRTVSDARTLAQIGARIGADFVNGDTMDVMPREFFDETVRIGHPMALQPEWGPDHLTVPWTTMGWGYWSETGVPNCTDCVPADYVPGVDVWKWVEPRHMTQICNRWAWNHTTDLQQTFFNGIGFVPWENIWGIYYQLVDHDAEALRRISTLLHFLHPFLLSPAWVPHTQLLQSYSPVDAGLFASLWSLTPDTSTADFPLRHLARVWTIVKRTSGDWPSQPLVRVPCENPDGVLYFDLYHGTMIETIEVSPSHCGLPIAVESNGFGAALAIWPDDFATHALAIKNLLQTMSNMTAVPLSAYSTQTHILSQRMTDWGRTSAPQSTEGMRLLPAIANWTFVVSGTSIECKNTYGCDVQYSWESVAVKHHAAVNLSLSALWMDEVPVTNSQYLKFLQSSAYWPAHGMDPARNFLNDWMNCSESGPQCRYADGRDNQPVTWVDFLDARAYCEHYGKRLPNDWEWQYAAQGPEATRQWPWGDVWDQQAVSPRTTGTTRPPPPDVGQYPRGASPFGVLDMMGLVWQWTNEFTDERTRAGLIRGGAYYRPTVNAHGGSSWYFPGNIEPDGGVRAGNHNKLLLMAPAYDRHGTVGFRCVADA